MDLGKLSVDLEMTVLKDNTVLSDNFKFEDWRTAQLHFLRNPEADPIGTPHIKAIYSLCRQLFIEAKHQYAGILKPRNANDDANIQNLNFQFQLVRLRELLIHIAYHTAIREKIFFAIRASLDIIEELTKQEKEILKQKT